MIQIDRKNVASPEVLTKSNKKGPKEIERAKQLYEQLEADPDKDVSDFKFKFTAYKDDEVREKFDELFHGKCAYCEQDYSSTQPVDIEHWRPKGKADRKNRPEMKPGYYWLAATWENLLPSCIDCNRSRRQKLPGGGIQKLGKQNQFPIRNEDNRQLNHHQPNLEEPLILNPCDDLISPKDHLEFTPEAVIKAKKDDNGNVSELGENSVYVYALNRTGLVHARLEVLRLMEQRKYTITWLMILHDDNALPEHLKIVVEDLIGHEIAALEYFMKPEQPFSAMARGFIEEFRDSIGLP